MVVKVVEESIGEEILGSSDRGEDKFNVLVWTPKKVAR